ncbi:MAG: hypothetical protein MAG795_00768 [Candidatus Woesearchaeota archaeon]|nr:hypothetical protein [Candidatus Woesearchaeota archaeon]
MFLPFKQHLLIGIVSLVFTIPLGALMLFFSAKIFKKELSYVKALVPALIVGLSGFMLGLIGPASGNQVVATVMGLVGFFVGITLYLTLPKLLLKYEWPDSLKVGAVWFGFMLVVSFIIGLIVVAISLAFLANTFV